MKNLKTIIAVVATGALLFGCSAPTTQNNTSPQTSVSSSSQAAVSGGQTQNNGSVSSQTTSNGSASSVPSGSLAEYQTAIDSLSSAISSAQPPADYNSKYQEFSNYQIQLEGIENSLDVYEDQLEYGRSTGNVDMSSYQNEMSQINSMESQLDMLENQLEMKYGIDD